MTPDQIIEADHTWVDGKLAPGVQVAVDASGTIRAVGTNLGQTTRHLTGRALFPGFVNAHSHAFQRALRGIGEEYPSGAGSFWTWREAMYQLVQQVDRRALHGIARRCFSEMLRSGFTTVGEFHYLRHQDAAARDCAFDEVVLDAAREVGLRIVLLVAYYRAGGFGSPLAGGQTRFATPTVAEFFERVDQLRARVDGVMQAVGIAPHSLRAVPAEDWPRLIEGARDRGLMVHTHLEEQRKELDDCRQALGTTPMRWLLDNVDIGARVTAVHATHTDAETLEAWLGRGAGVCICPITEANLGDGIPRGDILRAHAQRVCVGSDSNIRLDPFEELRWLEHGQRLRSEQRGAFRDSTGHLGRLLWEVGTASGADRLGVPTGRIAVDHHADLIAIDLGAPVIDGVPSVALSTGLIFGAGASEVVTAVCVGGKWHEFRAGS